MRALLVLASVACGFFLGSYRAPLAALTACRPSAQTSQTSQASVPTPPTRLSKTAYATYCTNGRYETGSRVVLFSAIASSRTHMNGVLMHTHALTMPWANTPVATVRVSVPVKRTGYYTDVLTKLLIFTLPYDRVVYIPHCRWCGPGYVTSTLMVVQPSQRMWLRLRRAMDAAEGRAMYDMDILNEELREDVHRLPSVYGMLNSEFENRRPTAFYGSTFGEVYKRAFFVHFTALGKPWDVRLSEVHRKVNASHVQPEMLDLYTLWHSLLERSYLGPWNASSATAARGHGG